MIYVWFDDFFSKRYICHGIEMFQCHHNNYISNHKNCIYVMLATQGEGEAR